MKQVLFHMFLMSILLMGCKGDSNVVPPTPKDSTITKSENTKVNQPPKAEVVMSPAKLLIRKWVLSEIYPSDPEGAEYIGNYWLEFKEDGTYIETEKTVEREREYKLSPDGKTLMTQEHTKLEDNVVNELTADKLVFTSEFGKRATFVPAR